jgi:hypothetical protein
MNPQSATIQGLLMKTEDCYIYRKEIRPLSTKMFESISKAPGPFRKRTKAMGFRSGTAQGRNMRSLDHQKNLFWEEVLFQ